MYRLHKSRRVSKGLSQEPTYHRELNQLVSLGAISPAERDHLCRAMDEHLQLSGQPLLTISNLPLYLQEAAQILSFWQARPPTSSLH